MVIPKLLKGALNLMEIKKLSLTLQQVAGESGLECRPNCKVWSLSIVRAVSPLTAHPSAAKMELQKLFAPALKIDELFKLDNLIIILSEK